MQEFIDVLTTKLILSLEETHQLPRRSMLLQGTNA